MKRISIVLALAGLAATAGLLAWFDAGAVLDAALSVGWPGFSLLLLWQMALFLGLGLSWWIVLPRVRPGLLVWGRMVRDAAGTCLPFSHVGGYVLGARAVTVGGVPWPTAAASTVVDVTTEIVSQMAFTLFGLAVLVLLRPGSPLVTPVAVGLVLVTVGMFAAVRYRGPIGRALRGLGQKLLGGWFRGHGALGQLEAELVRLYGSPARLLAGVGLHIVCWIGTGTSTWVALRLLGWEADYLSVMALEALLNALVGAAFVVPGAVGVQEAGYVAIGAAFGLPPELSLSVALLRRARDLALGLPILLVFQWIEVRRLK
ncbi:MAG: flippase-like domain-containing protein [Gemmatimonadaceae bacterium]|nr:flippase-like domain-containing protein [Acetobacteraceae bacterium]